MACTKRTADRCIDALIKMGVLVENTDRTAVRRTADFFLKNFQVRFGSVVDWHLSLVALLRPRLPCRVQSSLLQRPGRDSQMLGWCICSSSLHSAITRQIPGAWMLGWTIPHMSHT